VGDRAGEAVEPEDDDSAEGLPPRVGHATALLSSGITFFHNVGEKRLDELTTFDLIELQARLSRRGRKAGTIDGTVHSALRGMLRDTRLQGFAVPNLSQLYDRAYIRRLSAGAPDLEINPYSEDERDRIIEAFKTKRSRFFPFVFFQFWTGPRTSEESRSGGEASISRGARRGFA
jgi:hypothetical protein